MHHFTLGDGLRHNSRVHLVAFEAAQLPDPPPPIRRALRAYCIRRQLGVDAFGGLAEFADGLPLDKGGDGWLAIHLAAAFGHDSVEVEQRFEWAHDRAEVWRRIAADPLAHLEWADPVIPNPLAALAAVFEYATFLDVGLSMLSRLPIVIEDRHLGSFAFSPLPPSDDAARLRDLSRGAFEAREAGIEVSEDEAGTFATHASTAWDLVHFLQEGVRVPRTVQAFDASRSRSLMAL